MCGGWGEVGVFFGLNRTFILKFLIFMLLELYDKELKKNHLSLGDLWKGEGWYFSTSEYIWNHSTCK